MVSFDRLALSLDVGRSEVDDHAWLDDSSLNSANWNCTDTTDFVDILERDSERLIGRSLWRLKCV